jgi:glycerol-3-phosphate dehydrogenase
VHALSRTLDVDMPICTEVYLALHEGKPAREALDSLLARELKQEIRLD